MWKKIYLATSWKNIHYDRVLRLLRDQGHAVYDFRAKGFLFSNINPKAHSGELTVREEAEMLDHPTAAAAYEMDRDALNESDILVMLYPCGNDAHLELGYAAARGNYTIVYINDGYRVGLMDKMANKFVYNDQELLEALR